MTTEQVVDNAVTWASQGEKILLKNFVFKKFFLTKRNFLLYLPKENQFSQRKNLSNPPGKINVSPKEKILYTYPEKVKKKNYFKRKKIIHLPQKSSFPPKKTLLLILTLKNNQFSYT